MKADCLRCQNYYRGECKAFAEKIYKPIRIVDCKAGLPRVIILNEKET